MKESIAFDPDVDERALDKEVQKIDSKLGEVDDEITPKIDDRELQDLSLDGVGTGVGGGGGGGGMGGMGAEALASKIPKPIAGVSVASALPVALGGAVGMGMLNAMRNASARLQTSASLLGQAWNNVWRPMGDDLDKFAVRPFAKEMVEATQEFEDTYRNDSRLDALIGLGDDLGMENLIPGVGPLKFTIDAAEVITGEQIELPEFEWPDIGPSDVVRGIGWPEIGAAAILNPIAWPAVGAAALLGHIGWPTISSGDLLDRLTEDGGGSGGGGSTGSTTSSPSHPDHLALLDGTPDRPSHLDALGGPSGGGGGGGGGGAGAGGMMPLQRGGIVQRPTAARVGEAGPEAVLPLSELERMMEGAARAGARAGQGGGGGLSQQDVRDLKQGIRDVNRNIKSLARAMADMSFEVDGETFGRAASSTRQNRVSDTNPMI